MVAVKEENNCIVCMEKQADCVFFDCGHLHVCMPCSVNLKLCPVCRKKILKVVKVFK